MDSLYVEGHQHGKTLHIFKATFSQITRKLEYLVVPYLTSIHRVIELDDYYRRLLDIETLTISRPAERVSKLTAHSPQHHLLLNQTRTLSC